MGRSSKWHGAWRAGDENSRGQTVEGLKCHAEMFRQECGTVR